MYAMLKVALNKNLAVAIRYLSWLFANRTYKKFMLSDIGKFGCNGIAVQINVKEIVILL
jgi:hypothetical protein